MFHKIRRLICLAVLLTLLVSVLPGYTASAVTTNPREQEVIQTALDTYRASQEGAGRYSFYGYCGTMVSWQLHVLGITSDRVKLDGKNVYDYFCYQSYTSGGFPVHPYSGGYWNLYTALNDITDGGTKDAYNIVVGFEYTPSEAGAMYGHGLVIFGIIDGVVYYNESGPTYPDGLYYPEGTPIACTIEAFARRYSYATLDGLIHFGRKSYSEDCTQYPAYLYAAATEKTPMFSEPCTPETDDRSKPLRTVNAGEYMSVIGLYVNPLGEYWYQVDEGGKIGYIAAGDTRMVQMRYDDVSLADSNMPGELRQGRNYYVSGNLYAVHNRVTTVRAQLFSMDGTQATHVLSATQPLDARRYSLHRSDLADQLGLPYLSAGRYRLELAAVVGNHYYADGELQTQWKTVKLWQSEFMVVTHSYSTYHVTFDADGGTTDMAEASIYVGDRLAQMPEATRPGYLFVGWFTADGVPVTERTVIAESVTLYARWKLDENAQGWYESEDGWVYLEAGQVITGFVQAGGMTFCLTPEGEFLTGMQEIDGRLFYFQPGGAMHLGWLENEEGIRYFTANGAAVGNMVIEDVQYTFDENGILQK